VPPGSKAFLVFTVRKIISSAATLLLLAATVFVMVKLIPGDEAHVAAGPAATPAQVAQVRVQLGLNHSVPRQFLTYLDRLIHGNLGTSIATHTSVSSGIFDVLPQTIELVVIALMILVITAVPTAVISATRQDRQVDRVLRTSVVLAAGLPTFWLALVAQYLIGSKWAILPISGQLSRGYTVSSHTGFVLVDALIDGSFGSFWNALDHLILPAIVLALPFGAQLYRSLRAELLQVLEREHLAVARAKGIPERRLIFRHVMPNAIGPALTVLGILFGGMVGGAVLVESVFGLPGIGSYLTNAVSEKDTFAVLGGVLVIGALVIVTNLAVDILQLVRDPRLRAGQIGG
jgi:ABC-type dipeptide/oligopeptide/nickel transport system permease component